MKTSNQDVAYTKRGKRVWASRDWIWENGTRVLNQSQNIVMHNQSEWKLLSTTENLSKKFLM